MDIIFETFISVTIVIKTYLMPLWGLLCGYIGLKLHPFIHSIINFIR